MQDKKRKNSGFSLVELSIVLVILGLLVGGVLGGQALIKAAELRKITQDIDKYRTAINAFRDKYRGLPGDIDYATRFWGEADADPATCVTTQGSGTETCNGNNDGRIALGGEHYRFWQQLANAGLIEGNYTGVPGPSPWGPDSYSDVIGENIPRAPYANAGVAIAWNWGAQHFWFNKNKRNHALTVARCCNGLQKNIEGSTMTPEDTWNIDMKIDDGAADTGLMQIYRGYWSNCTDSNTAPASYVLTSSAIGCQPLIDMGL